MKRKWLFKPKWIFALAMALWGTLGPFTRQIAVSSGELALYRAVLATVFIGGYLLFSRQKLDVAAVKRDLFWLLLSGIAMGLNWVLLFQAYRYTTISLATLSYYFAPVIVAIASPFLFREKRTRKQILCFGMSSIGLVLMIGVGGSGQGTDGLGILYGLGAAVLYATVVLTNKAIRQVTGIHRTLMQLIGAMAILIPYVALTGGVHLDKLSGIGWISLLVVGLVHTGIAYCLYFSSLKEMDGQSVAILSYIDPLVALLISFFVLGESMTVWQMIGGGLILGFTLYNEV